MGVKQDPGSTVLHRREVFSRYNLTVEPKISRNRAPNLPIDLPTTSRYLFDGVAWKVYILWILYLCLSSQTSLVALFDVLGAYSLDKVENSGAPDSQ